MTDQDLLYDAFFSDPSDHGVEVVVQHKGKDWRFRVCRNLTLRERQIASHASIHIELGQDSGPMLKDVD